MSFWRRGDSTFFAVGICSPFGGGVPTVVGALIPSLLDGFVVVGFESGSHSCEAILDLRE